MVVINDTVPIKSRKSMVFLLKSVVIHDTITILTVVIDDTIASFMVVIFRTIAPFMVVILDTITLENGCYS